jgi:hypothetical protein
MWVVRRTFDSLSTNGSMNMNRRGSCKGTNCDVRDGDGPLQIARHIAPVANWLEWSDLHPLNEADITNDR